MLYITLDKLVHNFIKNQIKKNKIIQVLIIAFYKIIWNIIIYII